MRFIKDLLSHPGAVSNDRKSELTRVSILIAWLMVAVVLVVVIIFACLNVGDHSSLWDAVLQARWALFRLVLSLGLILVGGGVAILIFNALECTELGKRLFVPDEQDFTGLHTIKVSNAGTILGFLFLACIAGLLLGVLR